MKRREAQLAERVLNHSREELDRADGKASLLLAASMVVVGAVLAAILAGQWRPFGMIWWLQSIWWIGASSAAVALISLAAAAYPKVKRKKIGVPNTASLIAYYGDIIGKSANEVQKSLERSAKSEAPLLDQLMVIAAIVHRKYSAIRVGLWTAGAAALLSGGSVLLQHYLR